jgi:dienelactone hydrolase
MEKRKLRVIKEGFDGVYFPVKKRRDKIIIILSGSEGGLEHAEKMAGYFQMHGIPAIAVGYFKTAGTPKHLKEIPVEYIGKVIQWLKKCGYEKIGIEGFSKGTEYAMACAVAYPEITCVILKTPSWFYSEGLAGHTPAGMGCFAFQGKSLPFTPYKTKNFSIIKHILKVKEYNILPINEGKAVTNESVIPVEKVNGPVLILSTKADTIWPSAESGEKLEERLNQKSFGFPYKHVCFSFMSHVMLENAGSSVRILFRSERHHPQECAEERRIMGQESINWVENVWE